MRSTAAARLPPALHPEPLLAHNASAGVPTHEGRQEDRSMRVFIDCLPEQQTTTQPNHVSKSRTRRSLAPCKITVSLTDRIQLLVSCQQSCFVSCVSNTEINRSLPTMQNVLCSGTIFLAGFMTTSLQKRGGQYSVPSLM